MDALKYLSDQLLEERNRIAEDLSDGKAKDHGEYKYSCGIVRGLLIANSHIYELSKRLEQDDE
jgi:hypothetical protein